MSEAEAPRKPQNTEEFNPADEDSPLRNKRAGRRKESGSVHDLLRPSPLAFLDCPPASGQRCEREINSRPLKLSHLGVCVAVTLP